MLLSSAFLLDELNLFHFCWLVEQKILAFVYTYNKVSFFLLLCGKTETSYGTLPGKVLEAQLPIKVS